VRIAQQSGAMSFELRAATNLAEFSTQIDRRDRAMERLAEIYEQFDSSFESTDLMAARRILEGL
jgi:hypothetical protein